MGKEGVPRLPHFQNKDNWSGENINVDTAPVERARGLVFESLETKYMAGEFGSSPLFMEGREGAQEPRAKETLDIWVNYGLAGETLSQK